MNSPKDRPQRGDRSDDLWAAAAREIARDPDSPASLRILSAFNQAVRPQQQANEQLVEAMAAGLGNPDAGELNAAAVAAAVQHWERASGATLDASTRALFQKDAVALHEQRKRQPPPLEQVLGPQAGRPDYGYALGVDLRGLQGTWHRLWAALVMERTWGLEGDDAASTQLRGEFEGLLKRSLRPEEWSSLVASAERRAKELATRSGG